METTLFGETELKMINAAKRVVIYGYGSVGKSVLKTLQHKELVIIDRNENIHTEGISVYTMNNFDWSDLKGTVFVVSSMADSVGMTLALVEKGVDEENIVYPQKVVSSQVDYYKNIMKKRTPRKGISFVVCITEHCNLNCARCDHFSPLSKEWYMSIADFEKDMNRMAELFSDNEVSVIDIEGGEPLLHKEIVRFMRIARDKFPAVETKIKVYTNALLLPKMSREFWEECVRSKITIRVTKYPIDFDYDKIKSMVVDKGVEFEFANDEHEEKSMIHQSLDIEGTQNKYSSFHNCYMSNGECAELRLGKFYQCNVIANLHIFNEFFGKDLVISPKDYIDIYSDITSEDIYDYLCNPIPACRYCKTKEWQWGKEWKVSQRKIEEWT